MREEKVTKNILDWLEENGWTIICYDFPQSGTGVLLHLNNSNRTEKNKGGIKIAKTFHLLKVSKHTNHEIMDKIKANMLLLPVIT